MSAQIPQPSTAAPRALLAPILALAAEVESVPAEVIPALLAALVGLQAGLLARLLAPQPAPPVAARDPQPDRLLTAAEAARVLGVAPRWMYRHSPRLPFTKRLSGRVLRFSEQGLQRYLAAKRP